MNTLFPADKADKIAEMFSFTDDEKQSFCNNVNGILQTHEDEDPNKIITAVCEYADLIAKSKGAGYTPKIARQKIGTFF